jgi:hypothetical protein
MSRGRTPMRRIRLVLEYRLQKGISAEQTALALSKSKGLVINTVHRFKRSGLAWPLPEGLSDSALESALCPPRPAAEDRLVRPDLEYIGLFPQYPVEPDDFREEMEKQELDIRKCHFKRMGPVEMFLRGAAERADKAAQLGIG